jgi:hypothetical protein
LGVLDIFREFHKNGLVRNLTFDWFGFRTEFYIVFNFNKNVYASNRNIFTLFNAIISNIIAYFSRENFINVEIIKLKACKSFYGCIL